MGSRLAHTMPKRGNQVHIALTYLDVLAGTINEAGDFNKAADTGLGLLEDARRALPVCCNH